MQNPNEHVLLDKPDEEKLRQEIDALRRELEEERKRNGKTEHDEHKPKRPKPRTLWLLALAVLAIVVIGFFVGWLPHYRNEKQLQEEARREEEALPMVNYFRARRSPPTDQLMLPGTIQALTDAPILARADGYIRKRHADIGDRVKAGQLLADIEAPDLDQQVRQAQAQLLQAEAAERQASASLEQGRANEELARVSAVRWQNLVRRGAVSRQENDTYQANYQAQTANVGALNQNLSAAQENVRAAHANLDRLLELQSYEHVRAPFSGVVTIRNVDTGALITTGQTLLFRVAQIDRVRTYVYVPQPNAPTVQVGQTAELYSPEFGMRMFPGKVTRTANSLDPTTRTLLTEVQLPNPNGLLMPGLFVQVNLVNQRPTRPLLIPGDALIVQSGGPKVAVIRGAHRVQTDQDQKQKNQKPVYEGAIHLESVVVGRDYGNALEILSGISEGDLVIVNPNDSVREGAKVRATQTAESLDEQTSAPGGAKQNLNGEQLQPEQGAEPAPKKPSQEKKSRGPGY